jgi:hypothetical protein
VEDELANAHTADMVKEKRIKLPLRESKNPGSLKSLTNAEIDDLLT